MNELTNYQIATLAIALLGGELKQIDREDIAIKVNQLAPGRFNWRKYPEFIDIEAVGTALRDAKKKQNGALIKGNNSDGWMLTPSGLVWFSNYDFIEEPDEQRTVNRRDSVAALLDTEALRLRNTKAYKLFINGEDKNITLQDFYQFARVNEYFQHKVRQRRYSIIENAIANDETLSQLWSLLCKMFKEEME